MAARRGQSPIIFALLLMLVSDHRVVATQSEYDQLYSHVFTDYNYRTMPLMHEGDSVTVSLEIYGISINDFDQQSGELSMSTRFKLVWSEQRLAWNASELYNIRSLSIPVVNIWRPRLFLRQATNQIQSMGSDQTLVKLTSDGQVEWTFGYIMKTTCSLDIRYFPFDTQTCLISLGTTGYDRNQLHFYSVMDELGTKDMSENSQWELLTSTFENGTWNVRLNLRLKRRSEFYIVYIVTPIILLGLINNLVFLMPASSGERTSFAITTLLSFVVYMDIVSDHVPVSSAPMAYMYTYLLFLMVYSSTTMFLTIISFRLYEKDGTVPPCLRKIVLVMMLKVLKSTPRINVIMVKESVITDLNVEEKQATATEEYISQTGQATCKHTDVTWKTVAATFDIYCSMTLLLTFLIFTIEAFSKLISNYGL